MRVSDKQHSRTWRERPLAGVCRGVRLRNIPYCYSWSHTLGAFVISQDIFLFAAFYPAIFFATCIGGPGVGVFAAVLGAAIAWAAFVPHPLGAGVQIKLLAYLLSSTLIIWGAEHAIAELGSVSKTKRSSASWPLTSSHTD